MIPARPRRFYSLDVLRGTAALTVVFWHWQHFFLFGGIPVPPTTQQPLHDVFYLFYGAGWMAVDLFFSLSGFIFFWLYAEAIAGGRISGREFFVLRFSRLYPLHLATLLAVAAGQRVFLHLTHGYFIYPRHDAYHFALNLPLASAWGFERGPSFNAPIWSVSIEALLYILFFLLCRVTRPRLPIALALSAVGYTIVGRHDVLIGRGVGSFFLGGAMFAIYDWCVSKGLVRALSVVLPPALVAAWVYVALVPGRLLRLGAMPWRSEYIEQFWPVPVLLFPLTIFTLVIVETRRGTLGRRLSPLGDISYSSYLLHFPLQLATALLVVVAGIDQRLFLSPAALVAFFAVLVLISLASYHWFEAPTQRILRTRLGARVRAADGRDAAAVTP